MEPPTAAARCFLLERVVRALVPLTCCSGVIPVVHNKDEQRKTVSFSDRAFLSLSVGVALLQDHL